MKVAIQYSRWQCQNRRERSLIPRKYVGYCVVCAALPLLLWLSLVSICRVVPPLELPMLVLCGGVPARVVHLCESLTVCCVCRNDTQLKFLSPTVANLFFERLEDDTLLKLHDALKAAIALGGAEVGSVFASLCVHWLSKRGVRATRISFLASHRRARSGHGGHPPRRSSLFC